MKKNNKGFTLIELLAVIVILAILVAVAIPSVTKYLNDARKGSIQNEAAELVTAARTYIVANNITKSGNFVFNIGADKDNKSATWYAEPATGSANSTGVTIENVVQKNLIKSPYGNDYNVAFVRVQTTAIAGKPGEFNTEFKLYLNDSVYCFNGVEESELNKDENLSVECTKYTTNPTTSALPSASPSTGN